MGLATSTDSLNVPSETYIQEGDTSAAFRVKAAVAAQDENAALTASSNSQSVTTAVSIRTVKPEAVSCEAKHLAAGRTMRCNLQLSSAAVSDSLTFALSSSSPGLEIPAQIGSRTGRNRIPFDVTAGAGAAPQSTVMEVRLGKFLVQETLLILPPDMLSLGVPSHMIGTPGSPMHFEATARDAQNLPLRVSASSLPKQAVFDALTGEFTWLPAESDLGRHQITFSTTDATGATVSKTATLDIELPHPTVTSLQNAADASAPAGCRPGSVATLLGRFLSGNDSVSSDQVSSSVDRGLTHVLVNGSEVPVVSGTDQHVDFVCPTVGPGTSLELEVKTPSGLSNQIRTIMHDAAPGIFTVDGPVPHQAFAWRTDSGDMALIPNFRNQGKPVQPGDKVSILATGIDCSENYSAQKPQIMLNSLTAPITSITSSSRKIGACELGITIPDGLGGDAVPLTLTVTGSDGRILTSNTASIAVENQP